MRRPRSLGTDMPHWKGTKSGEVQNNFTRVGCYAECYIFKRTILTEHVSEHCQFECK